MGTSGLLHSTCTCVCVCVCVYGCGHGGGRARVNGTQWLHLLHAGCRGQPGAVDSGLGPFEAAAVGVRPARLTTGLPASASMRASLSVNIWLHSLDRLYALCALQGMRRLPLRTQEG